MLESKTMSNLNKYIQGSVWTWIQNNLEHDVRKEGVQSGSRPVLIISNDTFNIWSPAVNCLTITSVLKDSPAHVPINLDVASHIQCEQIHTINKSELREFKGVIKAITLSKVKSKLKMQFNMDEDRSLEILIDIKSNIDELNEKAIEGFGLPAITGEMAHMLVNIHNCFEYIKTEIIKIQKECKLVKLKEIEKKDDVGISVNDDVSISDTDNKGSRRIYTDEDKEFILDEMNSIEAVMKRFGYKDKATAYNRRAYYKKKYKEQGNKNSKKKVRRERRIYTDEDKEFIIDETNSIDAIMERFHYKDKATAYQMRTYIRKYYSNQN